MCYRQSATAPEKKESPEPDPLADRESPATAECASRPPITREQASIFAKVNRIPEKEVTDWWLYYEMRDWKLPSNFPGLSRPISEQGALASLQRWHIRQAEMDATRQYAAYRSGNKPNSFYIGNAGHGAESMPLPE